MSLTTFSAITNLGTTARYVAFFKALSDALQAAGVVKTTDTGQINLTGSTLAYPTGGGTPIPGSQSWFSGYEIRKLTTSGLPTLYLKLIYGISAAASGSGLVGPATYFPAVMIQVGTSTDGAGALSGTDPAQPNLCFGSNLDGSYAGYNGNGAAQLSAQNHYVASDGANYLTIVLGVNAAGAENHDILLFSLERTRTASTGAYNGTGVYIGSASGSSSSSDPSFPLTPVNQLYWNLVESSFQWRNGVLNAQALPFIARQGVGVGGLFMPMTIAIPTPMAPSLGIGGIYPADYPQAVQFSVTDLFGATHLYVSCTRPAVNADPYSTTWPAIRID